MSRDEETGRVKVVVTTEMWTAIHQQGADPPAEIGRRGLDVLRMKYQCEEDEIQFIQSDPLYQNSCRTEYWEAKRMFDRKRKLPSKFRLDFNRPGTRKPNMKEAEAEGT
jgi:hypothetical protein